jgi:hypothetical protein
MTILFSSTSKRSSNAPGLFDAAYLAMQYRGEFDVLEVPRAMKHFVFPVVYWIGQALGLYKKYKVDSLGK